jgi:hypothetical protein
MTHKGWLLGVLGLGTVCACGQAQDEVPPHELEVEALEEALSDNEQCGTAAANISVSGATTWTSSVTTYGSSRCWAAFIVDWSDYAAYRFGPGTFEVQRFEHESSTATSQSECEKLRMGAVAYLTESGPASHRGTKWRWGQWMNGQCQLPTIVPYEDLEDTHGSNTRFALTARRYSRAKDSSASYELRSIESTWAAGTTPPIVVTGPPQ